MYETLFILITLKNVLHLWCPGIGFEIVKKVYGIVPDRGFHIPCPAMNQPFYQFTSTSEEILRFEFISVGKQIIPKVVIFSATDLAGIFSLTLANLLPDGSLDDMTVSDNGDREMILATVFQCLQLFLNRYPEAIVAFSGSSASRTRLYQIAIAHELQDATSRFNIWGLTQDAVEPFRPNKAYEGFLISLKSVNIV